MQDLILNDPEDMWYGLPRSSLAAVNQHYQYMLAKWYGISKDVLWIERQTLLDNKRFQWDLQSGLNIPDYYVMACITYQCDSEYIPTSVWKFAIMHQQSRLAGEQEEAAERYTGTITCPVCLDNCAINETVAFSPCGHVICERCVDMMTQQRRPRFAPPPTRSCCLCLSTVHECLKLY